MMLPAPPSARKKLGILPLIAIIFLTVSGGPYGLEPLLGYAGKNGALLLLIITPILWDIPTIFTVLELNSMMPVTGGYYQWVKKALGLRWALYEGWWTWLYTFVDLAIYPVLFTEYAAFFFPGAHAYKIPICLFIIWSSAGLNILGIVPVGKASLFLSALVLTPFIILFYMAFGHHAGSFTFPHLSLKGIGFSSLGLGLYTVMWNFIGWDNVTTYAEEVNKPIRTYLISIFTAFILIFSVYFLAVFVAQQAGINPAKLEKEGFPVVGLLIGGHWLGALLSFGGMASALGLYSAVLLSVSRVPKVMADDGLLPQKINKLHPKYKTPYVSILVCSVIISFMILWTFTDLLIIDVTLYGAALFLEFVTLIIFRIKLPEMPRPFKIPLNIYGLGLMALLPFSVYITALAGAFSASGNTWQPAVFAIGALLSGEAAWQIIRYAKKPLPAN
ncbi:APC family permease [Mucilaginibacter arboris]|uniref:Amino acid permease n=1 Tax=Mucilaginibacter arboris TaxID=2682090 RepID=A0A7K1SX33_9SPHI|nr:APC family permease [Mucilaginibacter arboris]MVN21797.1 amino acid permease [Mucilaginibacter arboris]